MGRVGHRVRLVQHHQLGHRRRHVKQRRRRGELDDLLPHDVNAALVRGVQVEHHHVGRLPIDLAGAAENCARLAGAGRAVKKQVGHRPCRNKAAQQMNDASVVYDAIKGRGPVLFDPRQRFAGRRKGHSKVNRVFKIVPRGQRLYSVYPTLVHIE